MTDAEAKAKWFDDAEKSRDSLANEMLTTQCVFEKEYVEAYYVGERNEEGDLKVHRLHDPYYGMKETIEDSSGRSCVFEKITRFRRIQ